ncbi:MAG: TonB-dependent receptor [Ginsengibacter sp.]
MKNILLLIIVLIGLHATSFAQKKILSRVYHARKTTATVAEFLEEIKLNSGVVLEYSSNNMAANKLVKLDGDENTLGELLEKVLEGQHLKLIEQNNKIMLVPSPEEFTLQDFLPARYKLYGYIKEGNSKEPLIDATVYESDSRKGVITNSYGYFNLSLTEGKHKIIISYAGMQPVVLEVDMHGNLQKDISLSIRKESYSPIVVQSESEEKNASMKVATKKLAPYNYLMGEADPVRAAYILPGVKKVPEALNGFLVRGGGIDENLFLLDGNPVYNPSHMLGALSIINQSVVKSIRLYKSDFPARFSGALSSVIDVYTKEGNMQSWHGEANTGLLAGSLTLEGPIVKNKTSVMVSARHSLSIPFYDAFQKGIKTDFYDAHFRLTQILNPKNKLSFNAYKGEDNLRQSGSDINNLHRWGNLIGSVGWNYLLGSRSFINTSVNFSQYQNLGGYKYTLYQNDDDQAVVQAKSVGTYSFIRQYNAKVQAEIYASKKIKINTGAKIAQTMIKPFDTKISNTLEEDTKSFTSFDPLIFDVLSYYSEAEIKTGDHFFVRPGLHISAYQFKDYHTMAFQPRFFANYRISPSHTLFASYSKMNQFLHLVTNPYLGVNSDLWVPSTADLKPERSDNYNLGYSFRDHKAWAFTLEDYYKNMSNVTNYAEGKSYFINSSNWQQDIETGKGRSYGTECMLERRGKKLTWQIAYTLSWSFRQFESINNGKEFPYKYDRRHDINIGVNYIINTHLECSALWTFATGEVYTLPSQVYPDFDNSQQISTPDDPLNSYRFVYHYSGVNQSRTAPFQRADFAINYHSKKDKKMRSLLTAGIYNITGAPDQYNYILKGSLSSKSVVIKTGNSIFNSTPYISYTLKF